MAAVLLIEDEFGIQTLVQRILVRLGHQVTCASNGAEAVEMALEGGYDVIFMDLQMPVMNGIAATEAIRDSQNLRQPIIIALTGYAAAAVKEECKRAGADDFLAKPAGLEDFQRILTAWLGLA